MKLTVQRQPSANGTTFGDLLIDGVHQCVTLEDQIREIPGQPVEAWKVQDETAIPAGTYALGLVNSPHFGPNTIAILGVPGFKNVRIHSGVNRSSTEGCITVGDRKHPETDPPSISGGLSHDVLALLRARVADKIRAGERCSIEILNPENQ